MTRKQAIKEWEKAFGQWLEAGSDAWRLAMKKMDLGYVDAADQAQAKLMLVTAHQRLTRALDHL